MLLQQHDTYYALYMVGDTTRAHLERYDMSRFFDWKLI